MANQISFINNDHITIFIDNNNILIYENFKFYLVIFLLFTSILLKYKHILFYKVNYKMFFQYYGPGPFSATTIKFTNLLQLNV